MLQPLYSDRDLERLGIRARSTAQKDRVAGRGIPFIRIGRLVRYRPEDVENYLNSLPTLRSTSEPHHPPPRETDFNDLLIDRASAPSRKNAAV